VQRQVPPPSYSLRYSSARAARVANLRPREIRSWHAMKGEGEGQLSRQASRPIGGTRMGHSCGDENLYADVGMKGGGCSIRQKRLLDICVCLVRVAGHLRSSLSDMVPLPLLCSRILAGPQKRPEFARSAFYPRRFRIWSARWRLSGVIIALRILRTDWDTKGHALQSDIARTPQGARCLLPIQFRTNNSGDSRW
jgi:hypothetical protein